MGWVWTRMWVDEPEECRVLSCLVAQRGGEVCECCRPPHDENSGTIPTVVAEQTDERRAPELAADGVAELEVDVAEQQEEVHRREAAPAIAKPGETPSAVKAEVPQPLDPLKEMACADGGNELLAAERRLVLTLVREGEPPLPVACERDDTPVQLLSRLGLGDSVNLARPFGEILPRSQSLWSAGLNDGDEVHVVHRNQPVAEPAPSKSATASDAASDGQETIEQDDANPPASAAAAFCVPPSDEPHAPSEQNANAMDGAAKDVVHQVGAQDDPQVAVSAAPCKSATASDVASDGQETTDDPQVAVSTAPSKSAAASDVACDGQETTEQDVAKPSASAAAALCVSPSDEPHASSDQNANAVDGAAEDVMHQLGAQGDSQVAVGADVKQEASDAARRVHAVDPRISGLEGTINREEVEMAPTPAPAAMQGGEAALPSNLDGAKTSAGTEEAAPMDASLMEGAAVAHASSNAPATSVDEAMASPDGETASGDLATASDDKATALHEEVTTSKEGATALDDGEIASHAPEIAPLTEAIRPAEVVAEPEGAEHIKPVAPREAACPREDTATNTALEAQGQVEHEHRAASSTGSVIAHDLIASHLTPTVITEGTVHPRTPAAVVGEDLRAAVAGAGPDNATSPDSKITTPGMDTSGVKQADNALHEPKPPSHGTRAAAAAWKESNASYVGESTAVSVAHGALQALPLQVVGLTSGVGSTSQPDTAVAPVLPVGEEPVVRMTTSAAGIGDDEAIPNDTGGAISSSADDARAQRFVIGATPTRKDVPSAKVFVRGNMSALGTLDHGIGRGVGLPPNSLDCSADTELADVEKALSQATTTASTPSSVASLGERAASPSHLPPVLARSRTPKTKMRRDVDYSAGLKGAFKAGGEGWVWEESDGAEELLRLTLVCESRPVVNILCSPNEPVGSFKHRYGIPTAMRLHQGSKSGPPLREDETLAQNGVANGDVIHGLLHRSPGASELHRMAAEQSLSEMEDETAVGTEEDAEVAAHNPEHVLASADEGPKHSLTNKNEQWMGPRFAFKQPEGAEFTVKHLAWMTNQPYPWQLASIGDAVRNATPKRTSPSPESHPGARGSSWPGWRNSFFPAQRVSPTKDSPGLAMHAANEASGVARADDGRTSSSSGLQRSGAARSSSPLLVPSKLPARLTPISLAPLPRGASPLPNAFHERASDSPGVRRSPSTIKLFVPKAAKASPPIAPGRE